MATLEEIEARRAERKAEANRKRDEQKAKDLEELMRLEDANPDVVYGHAEVEVFAEGFPALVIVRMPRPGEWKRYQQKAAGMVKTPAVLTDAQHELGLACTVYPEREVLAQLDEKRSGVITAAGQRAAQLCGAKVREEGKD